MFFANLFRWLCAGTAPQGGEAACAKRRVGVGDAAATGFRARSVDELIADHKEVIARIKLCYGCDNATFTADLLEPIRNYARYVNALPAAGTSHNCQAGGLLRLGLEVAFYALQATDSQIFAGRQTISNRRVLEPRWRRATFIAGLCSELYRCFNAARVRDGQGNTWQPYLSPLTAWLHQHRSTSFQVQWLAGPERRAPSLFALPMIVPASMMTDLAVSNDVIVPNMLAAISGLATYHEHNVMDRLVRHASALVMQRQRNDAGAAGVAEEVPVHLARHLVEAMRELVQSDHNWLPNASRSRLWYGADGLYLVWPNGAADVIGLLADERLPGAPDNTELALAILAAAGIVPANSPGEPVVQIQPPGAPEAIDAVAIVPPSLLLADLVPPPMPMAQRLVIDPEKTTPHCATPTQASQPASVPDGEPDSVSPRHRPARQEADGAGEPAQLPLPEVPTVHPEPSAKGGKRQQGQGRSTPTIGQSDADCDAAPGVQRSPALRPPMRLNRPIARALAAIVSTLYDEKPHCHVVAGALFVPLASLTWQGVDARQAWRSLQDAGMLVPDERGECVQSQVIDGTRLPGVFIARQFVTGVPVAAACHANSGERDDADA